jgi:hypothetical protein
MYLFYILVVVCIARTSFCNNKHASPLTVCLLTQFANVQLLAVICMRQLERCSQLQLLLWCGICEVQRPSASKLPNQPFPPLFAPLSTRVLFSSQHRAHLSVCLSTASNLPPNSCVSVYPWSLPGTLSLVLVSLTQLTPLSFSNRSLLYCCSLLCFFAPR